jgi:hypothetical protein
MMTDCVLLADRFAVRLVEEVRNLPDGFLDSFAYTTTGKNLTHPILLGILVRVVSELPGVRFVGVDARLNEGAGIKFQPDVVGFDERLCPLVFADYESPNSSDARIPAKDVDAYASWRQASGSSAPYVILTTLPEQVSPSWQLRYTSHGYYNHCFQGRRSELAANPFRFFMAYYRSEFSSRAMDGIAVVNLDGRRARRVYPE